MHKREENDSPKIVLFQSIRKEPIFCAWLLLNEITISTRVDVGVCERRSYSELEPNLKFTKARL